MTAVHIANALEHELHGSKDSGSPSTLDLFHIEALGLTHRIDAWKECLRDGKPQPQGKPSPKQSPEAAASAAAPVAPERTAPARTARTASATNRWLAAAAGAAVIGTLGWYFRDEWAGRKTSPKPADFRTSAREPSEVPSDETNLPLAAGATVETNKTPTAPDSTAPPVVTEPTPAESSKPEAPVPPKEKPPE